MTILSKSTKTVNIPKPNNNNIKVLNNNKK